ncbi:MAG: class I SAM-dependent methyltransferase [Actinobacteria bacterium]|nr:class I SAM-dependent methyltransferase [Actinomycetota bacterium]
MRDGIPRLVAPAWESRHDPIITATSAAFGHQWNRFGEYGRVGIQDLELHLPSGWTHRAFVGRVLDAGCGMGRYTALAAQLGALAIGMDISNSVDKAGELWPYCEFVQADLVAPPFAPRSFDLVYSFGVLHHLPDPNRGVKACFELVRPGGRLLLWVYGRRRTLLRRVRIVMRRLVARRRSLLAPIAVVTTIGLHFVLLFPRGRRMLPFYRDRDIRQLYLDCFDALSAPTEAYFDANDCRHLLSGLKARASGFEPRSDGSGWILWAVK